MRRRSLRLCRRVCALWLCRRSLVDTKQKHGTKELYVDTKEATLNGFELRK